MPLRWSDQDAFGHVNNAATVTLLEEARAALLFDAAARSGLADFGTGLLVASLEITYRRPIPWTPAGVAVEMWLTDLRAASFRVGYRVRIGPVGAREQRPAAEAATRLVPYDLDAGRPRRLGEDDRTFLARYMRHDAADAADAADVAGDR